MATKWVTFLLIFLIVLNGSSSVSASPPARIVAGIVTNVVSTVFKWLWSLRTPIKTEKAVSSRSLMKFEGGYTVETVFEGSKIGIEPYSVEATPTGDLLILDSANSNLYKISSPLSRYSRPKLVAGSPEGYTGHVDGKLREARLYHPKGITVDDSGNIYIADTINMAIRKISDTGMTTIAGGKWSHGGGHIDGPSEDAKFSDDFDLVYVRSTCSLLVTDRGNQAIREVQLHDSDCSYEHPVPVQPEEHEENFPLGIAVLIAAAFSGYMLALLKQRVQALFSRNNDPRTQLTNHAIITPSQRPLKSVRPPLIPVEDDDEYEREDEGLIFSFGRLIINAGSSMAEIFAGLLFLGFRKKKPRNQQLRQFQQLNRHPDHRWPIQDSYVIRDEDEIPALEGRTPIMRKAYPLMTRELDNTQQEFRQSQGYYEGQDGEFYQHQGKIHKQQQHQQQQPQQNRQQQQPQQPRQQQQPQQQRQHQHSQRRSPNPKTSHEKEPEKSEIVFGAVQEQEGRREAMVIKAVDFSDPIYSQHNVRPRLNYMGYSTYSYS